MAWGNIWKRNPEKKETAPHTAELGQLRQELAHKVTFDQAAEAQDRLAESRAKLEYLEEKTKRGEAVPDSYMSYAEARVRTDEALVAQYGDQSALADLSKEVQA